MSLTKTDLAFVLMGAIAASFIAHADQDFIRSDLDSIRENELSVCQILIDDTYYGLTQACSGTLIAPDRVISAAHCFVGMPRAEFEARVRCGYQKNGRFLEEYETTRWNFIADGTGTPFDLALVYLPKNSAITPMALVPTDVSLARTSEILAGTDPEVECRIAGYGDRSPGLPQGLLTAKLDLSKDKQIAARIITQDVTQMADHGDSGGPLYCRKANGPWRLFGVTCSIRTDADRKLGGNTFIPTEGPIFANFMAEKLAITRHR